MGLDPGIPGSHPAPKAGAKLLSHPGIPCHPRFYGDFLWSVTGPNLARPIAQEALSSTVDSFFPSLVLVWIVWGGPLLQPHVGTEVPAPERERESGASWAAEVVSVEGGVRLGGSGSQGCWGSPGAAGSWPGQLWYRRGPLNLGMVALRTCPHHPPLPPVGASLPTQQLVVTCRAASSPPGAQAPSSGPHQLHRVGPAHLGSCPGAWGLQPVFSISI